MGLQAINGGPRTSRRVKDNGVYPYLLRNDKVTRSNQVWVADITYIPMVRAILYLVAVVAWYWRCVMVWRLTNNLEADFCVDALQKGEPEVFNSAEGIQFTSQELTRVRHEWGDEDQHERDGEVLGQHLGGSVVGNSEA